MPVWFPTGPEIGWDKFVRDRLSGVTRAEVKELCEAFVEMGFFTVEHFKALQPKELLESRSEWHMLADTMFDKVREVLVAMARPKVIVAQPGQALVPAKFAIKERPGDAEMAH